MDESVKQNFQKLLEYQKKDIELKKLNTLIERDAALAGMNKNKKAFNDAKQVISDGEAQAGSLLEMYNELIKYVEDNEALLAEFEKAEATESEEELAERVKKLESLKSKFQSADRKAHDIDDKSKDICAKRAEAIRSGNIAKANYNAAKEKHTALVDSKADEMNALKSELDKMRGAIDATMFSEYQKLVEDNKFPPVVPASGDDKKGMYNCGGCGIGLSQQANTLVKDQGWCRCDNCRRIIVKLN